MLADDVREGLSQAGQKQLSCQYFYDDLGTALFEAIAALPEYGLTRADTRLIRRLAPALTGYVGTPATVAELGSGSGSKTRRILESLAHSGPVAYYPIDLSASALARCALEMAAFADVRPIAESYLNGLRQAVCAWAAPLEISRAPPHRLSCAKCAAASCPATSCCWART
jgi:uncharacterized SAM-dependent methyltransferase